jgi:hypothetical protein
MEIFLSKPYNKEIKKGRAKHQQKYSLEYKVEEQGIKPKD